MHSTLYYPFAFCIALLHPTLDITAVMPRPYLGNVTWNIVNRGSESWIAFWSVHPHCNWVRHYSLPSCNMLLLWQCYTVASVEIASQNQTLAPITAHAVAHAESKRRLIALPLSIAYSYGAKDYPREVYPSECAVGGAFFGKARPTIRDAIIPSP